VSPGLSGSQGPPSRSQKAPPPVICVEARRAVTPVAVAHSKVPGDQRVDDWCSCVLCSECEPSII
jgi:hypothetical protein